MRGTFIPDFKITGLTAEGTAFGIFEDTGGEHSRTILVLVEKGIPEDVADIQMIKSFKDKTIARGKILHLKKSAASRQDAFCKHFEYCGGCQRQNLNYEAQLRLKQQQVQAAFHSQFSILNSPLFLPPIPCEKQIRYRNRVTFTFSNRRWMSPEELEDTSVSKTPAAGYALKGKNDRVMQIEECFLTEDFALRLMNALQQHAIESCFSFYDARNEKGFLRGLTVRFGANGEIMVIPVFAENSSEKIAAVLTFLQSGFPEITSLYYVIHSKKRGLASEKPHVYVSGNKHLTYELENLKFKIGPSSFYQTNTDQAVKLFHTAKDFMSPAGGGRGWTDLPVVYDLYSGCGTIALFVSNLAQKVIGLEYSGDSVKEAYENAALNTVSNVEFLSGDMRSIFNEDLFSKYGRPDVVITDPPRGGMDREVINNLLIIGAERIVYISCNPATQARDLRQLSKNYHVVKSQMVDMFPQTSHIENIVLLQRK